MHTQILITLVYYSFSLKELIWADVNLFSPIAYKYCNLYLVTFHGAEECMCCVLFVKLFRGCWFNCQSMIPVNIYMMFLGLWSQREALKGTYWCGAVYWSMNIYPRSTLNDTVVICWIKPERLVVFKQIPVVIAWTKSSCVDRSFVASTTLTPPSSGKTVTWISAPKALSSLVD